MTAPEKHREEKINAFIKTLQPMAEQIWPDSVIVFDHVRRTAAVFNRTTLYPGIGNPFVLIERRRHANDTSSLVALDAALRALIATNSKGIFPSNDL